jgi:hypothetical protein
VIEESKILQTFCYSWNFSSYKSQPFSSHSLLEPITQILGVREGDLTGEIFINMGSTINLTCIVRNLPEPPSIQWTHNGEVSKSFRSWGAKRIKKGLTHTSKGIKFFHPRKTKTKPESVKTRFCGVSLKCHIRK